MIKFITPECPKCGETTTLTITEEQLTRWENWQKTASKKDLLGTLPLPKSLERIFPEWTFYQIRLFHTGRHINCMRPRREGRYI